MNAFDTVPDLRLVKKPKAQRLYWNSILHTVAIAASCNIANTVLPQIHETSFLGY